MDVVNKWLMVVILFMAALVGAMIYMNGSGSGRYQLAVNPSTLNTKFATVYVLDTKTGEVQAKIVDEEYSLIDNDNVPHRNADRVFDWYISPRYRSY